jgi:hypothetical protein
MRRKRKKPTKKGTASGSLPVGVLPQSEYNAGQAVRIAIAAGKRLGMTAAMVLAVGYSLIDVLPPLIRDTATPMQRHVVMGLSLIALPFVLAGLSVLERTTELKERFGLERLDFDHVGKRDNIALMNTGIASSLLILTALYMNGTVSAAARAAGAYLSRPDFRSAVAWCATTAISGIIGNGATAALAWIAGRAAGRRAVRRAG